MIPTPLAEVRPKTTNTLLHGHTQTTIEPFAWRLLPEFQLRRCGFPANLVLDFDPTPLRQPGRREADAQRAVDQ